MFSKSVIVGSALAASVQATPTFFGWGNSVDSPWYCWAKELVAVPAGFPVHNLPAASSFCSSYLSIAPSTSTVTQSIINSKTATVTKAPVTNTITPTTSVAGSTVTTTPTSVVPSSVKTCYFTTSAAAGQIIARAAAAEPTADASFGWGIDYTQAVKDACQCDGVNLQPAAVTTTVTTTVDKVVATSTIGGQTVQATAPAVTITGAPSTKTATPVTVSSGVATSTIPPSGSYTSPQGTKFIDFLNYDFYGNDLDAQYCGANGQFKLPNNQTVPCTDFTSCTAACSAYNAATGSSKCVGVSYLRPSVFCYLKNTINVCNPMPNSNVDSAAIVN